MFIHKCDFCKKVIKDRDKMITVGLGERLFVFEFCFQCGEPVRNFLKEKKLIEND